MLSSGDIFSQAGPCPLSFLSNPRTDFAGRAANVTELDSMVEEEEADPEQEGEEDFDEDTRQDLEENEDVESENDFAGGAFATRKVGARRKIRGGLDIERDAQLIMLFMQQCRLKGQGCALDLGRNHPFGAVGFVRYHWTETDKAIYDRTGRPPCWVGKLSSETPMVTMHINYTQWRYGTVPREGTPGEVAAYTGVDNCLVVCQPFTRETYQFQSRRYIVPSQFTPTTHIGVIKYPVQPLHLPLFLENKVDIERFSVNRL